MLHNGQLFWRSQNYLHVATQTADLQYDYKIEITTERVSSNLWFLYTIINFLVTIILNEFTPLYSIIDILNELY